MAEAVAQGTAAPAATDREGIEQVDVLIVGAGLSGIGAAIHLQRRCPGKRFVLLEARDAIGGTWDLFRYPGVRSDSDMYTLGYAFKPWTHPKAIADGPSIRSYIREAAAENGVDKLIRFGLKVRRASWSSDEARWTVEAERKADGAVLRLRCSFLYLCGGYYSYAGGPRPSFEGEERFRGTVVHPQSWPEDLRYEGRRVVVIGSGATAVTIVPEMARTAAHVVMLQRSPTYCVSRPSVDRIVQWLERRLPTRLAYALTRWKNVLLGMFFFRLARRRPEKVKQRIIRMASEQLGPGYDVGTHFTPRYNPWDQRVCLVPDADLFKEIRRGAASVVTDEIDRFTEGGIRLKSGKELEADIIVVATGLQLNVLSDVEISVDGERKDFSRALAYKGMMFSDVPNLVQTFGYTNASWTLKADLTADYVCRLLRYMDAHRYAIAVPRPDPSIQPVPFLDFSSGYVRRAIDKLPKQGSRRPWRLYQNYVLDLLTLRHGRVADGVMQFARAPAAARAVAAGAAGIAVDSRTAA